MGGVFKRGQECGSGRVGPRIGDRIPRHTLAEPPHQPPAAFGSSRRQADVPHRAPGGPAARPQKRCAAGDRLGRTGDWFGGLGRHVAVAAAPLVNWRVRCAPVPPTMLTLPQDALERVLGELAWPDLLRASQASAALATATRPLWRSHCERRWSPGGLNTHLFASPPPPAPPLGAGAPLPPAAALRPPSPPADYKALFLRRNGWAPGLELELRRWAGCRWADELVAVQPGAADGASGTSLVAVSTCRELRVLELGAQPGAQLQTLRAGMHAGGGPGTELWSAVAALPDGMVAAGGCHGRLALFRLPAHHAACCSQERVQPAAALALPGNRWGVRGVGWWDT